MIVAVQDVLIHKIVLVHLAYFSQMIDVMHIALYKYMKRKYFTTIYFRTLGAHLSGSM